MTISSTNRKSGPYTCNGSTVAYPFDFNVFAAADLLVVLTDASGAESDLTLTTDYTVSINSDQQNNPGGTVTTNTAYTTGYLITITSNVQPLQAVQVTNLGGFYPQVINNALDKLTILVQQTIEQVSRAVKVNISSTITPDQLMQELNTQVSDAAASATAAASSEANAATSAAQAASSAAALPNVSGGADTIVTVNPTGNGWLYKTASQLLTWLGANLANGPVVLDSSSKLPAVDGSNLLNIFSGANLANGPVVLDSSSKLPAVDGSNLFNVIQAGFFGWFAGSTAPSGWLSVPTAPTNISRTTYAALFAAIGTTWGAGDGSTTFGLPYLLADGTLVASSGNVGTTTVGALLNHNHSILAQSGSGGASVLATATATTGSTFYTNSVGGSNNLAAGSRALLCIKY